MLDALCPLAELTANFSLDNSTTLSTALSAAMVLLKLVLIFQFRGLKTALEERYGKTQVQLVAGLSKHVVGVAQCTSQVAKLVLILSMFSTILRNGLDVAVLPALLLLVGALRATANLVLVVVLLAAVLRARLFVVLLFLESGGHGARFWFGEIGRASCRERV